MRNQESATRAAFAAVCLAVPVVLAAGRPPQLRVFVTGESAGYLEPCGCAGFKVGGVGRRATLLGSLASRGTTLYVDNGDLVAETGRQSQLKAETWVQLLLDMRLDALNLGEADWALGVDFLRSLHQSCRIAFLCANVRGSSADFVKPSVLLERGGVSVAVVGLLSDSFLDTVRAANPEAVFVSAEEALVAVESHVQADVCIVLYHGAAVEAEALLASRPWVQLAVAAHEGDSPMEPRRSKSGAMIVTAGRKAQHVLEVVAARRGGKFVVEEATAHVLGDDLAEAPNAAALVEGYLARLRVEGLLTQVPKEPLPDGQKYLGSDACRRCHAAEYAVWQKSAHARAYGTLVRVRHDADPECVGCHVVGLRHQSGFAEATSTAHLRHVGCESCHGPGALHAANPEGAKQVPKSKESCSTCHVPDHSPDFAMESYWAKIAH